MATQIRNGHLDAHKAAFCLEMAASRHNSYSDCLEAFLDDILDDIG